MSAPRLSWYVARLRNMSPREVAFRVHEQFQRQRYRRKPAEVHAVAALGGTGLGQRLMDLDAAFGASDYWVRSSRTLRERRLSVLHAPVPYDGDMPAWSCDPITGRAWPHGHAFDIDFRQPPQELADVKFVWEMNRLCFLLPVACWARLARDQAAADDVYAHALDWMRSNPRAQGVNWTSGIELAFRVTNLIVCDELLASSGLARPDAWDGLLARTVAEHVDWLVTFPSLHSSANNHRVAELAALVVAGCRYPGLVDVPPVASELWDRAQTLLLEDGSPAEQSTGYAALVVEWLLAAVDACPRSGVDVPLVVRDRLGAAGRFYRALTDADGHTVNMGDSDGSRLLTAAAPLDKYTDVLLHSLGAAPAPAGETPVITTFASCTAARSQDDGREVLWVMEHGPLGWEPLAAHGHADALSVWLHYDGEPLLIDAGTYRYAGEGAWRDYLRSTYAHNTLVLAEVSSSTSSGPFSWVRGERERATLTDLVPGDAYGITARHDGYERLGAQVQRRLRRVRAGHYELHDEVLGVHHVPVRAGFLLAPGVEATATAEGWTLRRDHRIVAEIDVKGPGTWTRRSVHGEQPVDLGGWCAPSFNELVPTTQLLLEGALGLGQHLTTSFVLR